MGTSSVAARHLPQRGRLFKASRNGQLTKTDALNEPSPLGKVARSDG